ncbi:cytochrome P450 [Pendulispora brunnea]|uniref:Cytochrome P450 n=1 Tax=Pendulispora brunnea TaxID=2905690 RepID=A0ABZ2KTQ4_9BACT
MAMSDTIPPMFDPFEPGFFDDPYPQYRLLRDEDPVHEHPMLRLWFLTRYEDVSAVLRAGLSVEARSLTTGDVFEQSEALSGTRALVDNHSMLERDPPDHTRLRSLVAKVFTRRAVAALEPEIARLVDDALERLACAGTADLVETLAFPLPFTVISRMLGMPPTDSTRIRELSGALVRSWEPIADSEIMDTLIHASAELMQIIRSLIDWKRRHPADDLLTALIAAEHEGTVLSEDELVSQVVLLYVAGHETTVNLIANGVVALLRNPDQLELLRSQPHLASNAVEEVLRYDTPVQLTRRITIAPHTIGDKEIPAGSLIIPCLGSANRDERFFGSSADQLRIERPEARSQISFGVGPHRCVGAALARLQGRIAIERLVKRFPNLSLADDVAWNNRINLRGAARVPVSV